MSQRKKDRPIWVVLPEGKDFYSMEEVAEILKVKKGTVQNYITNEVIKAEKIDGRRMISRSALCRRLSELGIQGVYGMTFTELNP